MSDDNRHILQAAEEKMARMSAELGRVRNELDRYSRDLVEKERECDKLRKIVAKDATDTAYSSHDAHAICKLLDERNAYRKALEDIIQVASETSSPTAMREIAEQALEKETP